MGASEEVSYISMPFTGVEMLEAVVTGSDVKNGKPSPEPYLKALKLLRVKAKEAVAIENAPFGVRSAKAAGLRCLALETSLSKEYLKEADAIFPNIKNLLLSVFE